MDRKNRKAFEGLAAGRREVQQVLGRMPGAPAPGLKKALYLAAVLFRGGALCDPDADGVMRGDKEVAWWRYAQCRFSRRIRDFG